jgi:Na+-translocating ferredoxin:NAD+ oxidoreductase RNF subunit RnfB
MNGIVLAALVIGITGVLIGLLLGVAGKIFAVEVDERVTKVRDELPGNNCGGCGFAGCDGLAEAIVKGEAAVNGCPVGGAPVAEAIAAIMGASADVAEKQVAFVKCNGTCDKTAIKYNYYGIQDCRELAMVPGHGEKQCVYGCMGYGSCVKACEFDALHIVHGVAKVDKEKCVACGQCIKVCPNNLIEFVPYSAVNLVQCNSNDKGKDVKAACDVGCIGCSICVKQCEFDAVKVTDNLAYIDQSKCTSCGKCAEKCPSKIITMAS